MSFAPSAYLTQPRAVAFRGESAARPAPQMMLWGASRVSVWASGRSDRERLARQASASSDDFGRAPASMATGDADCRSAESDAAQGGEKSSRQADLARDGHWGGSLAGAFDAIGPDASRAWLEPAAAVKRRLADPEPRRGQEPSRSPSAPTTPAASQPHAANRDAFSSIHPKTAETHASRPITPKDAAMSMDRFANVGSLPSADLRGAFWGAGANQEILAPWKAREMDGSWISPPGQAQALAAKPIDGPATLDKGGYLGRLAAARQAPRKTEEAAAARRARRLGGFGSQ